jgi:hypothetical protein
MAEEIELPGKALARAYASIEVYKSKHSPIAAIFFERAYKLGGEGVTPMASMNSVGDTDEDVEDAYRNVHIDKQPASRRQSFKKHLSTKGKK